MGPCSRESATVSLDLVLLHAGTRTWRRQSRRRQCGSLVEPRSSDRSGRVEPEPSSKSDAALVQPATACRRQHRPADELRGGPQRGGHFVIPLLRSAVGPFLRPDPRRTAAQRTESGNDGQLVGIARILVRGSELKTAKSIAMLHRALLFLLVLLMRQDWAVG